VTGPTAGASVGVPSRLSMTDAVRTTPATADRGTAIRYAADCALIVAGLLLPIAIVAALFQPSWSRTTVWLPALFMLCAAGPFVLVGRALKREGATWAIGAATGLGWMAMLLIIDVALFGDKLLAIWARGGGLLWLLMGYLLAAHGMVSNVMPRSGYVLFIPFFIASAYLAKNAHRARAGIDLLTNHEWFRGWTLSVGYVLVGLPVFLKIASGVERRELAKRDERSKYSAQANVDVRKLLRRVQNCLYWYESQHPAEGFPRDLAAVGALGTGCFDTTAMTGTLAHSRVRYAAGTPDSTGRIGGFWLVAEPTSEDAFWRRQYYADEAGVVYYADLHARDDSMFYHHKAPDSPLPPPGELLEIVDSPVEALRKLHQCLHRPIHEGLDFPMRLEQRGCWWRAQGDDAEMSFPVSSRFANQIEGGRYSLEYQPRRPLTETEAAGYIINARPVQFGVDGVRSYWTDEFGRIHWTRENRAATADDPVIEECDLGRPCEG
jgi:hypothetical protein